MKFLAAIKVIFTYFNCKTIVFNFYYLPFKEAVYLPIFLSRTTKLRRMKGSVGIYGPVSTGMIRIGTNEIGIYDKRHNRAIWENLGDVAFEGKATIRYGASIIVGEGARLKLGDCFRISSGSSLICYKSIEFGQNCRISWDSQIIDTDFHKIFNENKELINPDKEIRMGSDCWIGNHCIIQKGTILGNMVVVASNTLVSSSIPDNNVILAGSPARIIKTSISWGE